MVMMSSLEKVSPVSKHPPVLRDPKLGIGAEDGNVGAHRTLSRSINQHQRTLSERPLVGVIAAQNESSLFSSSLSELVNHKMRLSSNKFLSRQSSTITSHKESQEEPEGQTINNLLPDEEELFSGLVDELGLSNDANGSDDLEEFDVFGGIELEADDHLPAGQRNASYSWGLHQKHHSVHAVDHASGAHAIARLPNGVVRGDASPHEGSLIFNGFHSPVSLSAIGSEFGVGEASQSFPQVHLDNHRMPSFHPHSHQVQLHNVSSIIPQNSLDGVTGIADNIGLKVPKKVNLDAHHLGLTGHAMDLNDGVFGYSPNGIHVHQSVASKSNSYQQHHLRSLLMANSPSFASNHAHYLEALHVSLGASHLTMNMSSPIQQLQVGSAPVLKASLWDRQQVYIGDSRETSGYQMGAHRSIGIPGFSPAHAREISSHGSLPRAHSTYTEMSKISRLHSPQRIGHMFHERSGMNSLPTSFGSPSERVRSRRNEANLSHADRKHYELNIDRILRGEDTRTTLMIKNIPNKYTSKMLLATIDEQHRGKYDFIYLPIDFKNKCNMGYAFINMVDPLQIVAFHKTFEGRKWEKFNSEKVATLAYARIQGKAALIAHFQNSSLMNEDKRCRPILFHTDGPNAGDQEPFPMGTNFRPKPGRLQAPIGEEDE